jgi:hypothetical protein
MRHAVRSIPGSTATAIALSAIAVALAAPALSAGDGVREKAITPRSIEKITGPEVEKAVAKVLAGVHWHTDLSHALATAAEEKKPVFWLQLVGGLDDGL